MKKIVHQLLQDKTGATVIEYGLLLAVFSTFVIFGIKALASGADGLWSLVEQKGVAAMTLH